MHDEDTEWYWDLEQQRAVPADARGPAEHLLGPYPTRGEAENWKSRVEQRNDAWESDDEEWEHRGESSDESD